MKQTLFVFCLLLFASPFHSVRSDDNSSSKTTSSSIDLSLTESAEKLGKAFAAIANSVRPAVVSVYSEKIVKVQRPEWLPFPFSDEEDFLREFFGGNRNPKSRQPGPSREYRVPQRGMGSGMLLDHDGNILTNYHVVQNVDEIKVQFADQKKWVAKVVGMDAKTDVAIIRVQNHGFKEYSTVTWGDSEKVQVGDVVVAIGAPFGLTQTVTHGIISAKGRGDVGIVDYEDFLQTDAPINPGNSGGPLVNTRGEIIGMNSAIATSVGQSGGIGFAIPSNLIRSITPRLIKGETIIRGEFGIGVQALTEDLGRHFDTPVTGGVLVSQIIPKSAAEKAGLKVGDIITRFDDTPIDDVRSLRNRVAGITPGTKVKIEILRKKKTMNFTATMGQQKVKPVEDVEDAKQPEKQAERGVGPLDELGITAENLTKDLAKRYQTVVQKGAIITSLERGGLASISGLQVGDVIIQANHKEVRNVDDLKKILSKSDQDSILLLVMRQGGSTFVTIDME